MVYNVGITNYKTFGGLKMQKYTLDQWACHEGLTFEEVYEPDVTFIFTDGNDVYKQLESTGELILLD